MIASLRGTLLHKSPTEAVIDVGGVGFALSIPLSTYETLGEPNTEVSLLTHLHVREDVLQLFGFATEEERELFRLLLSVSGIGPKMAQSILSGVPTAELKNHIVVGNLSALTSIPGVGRKIAERLVVELREKIGRLETETLVQMPTGGDTQSHVRAEALLALTSLGYNRAAAEKALRTAIRETSGKTITVELLIKTALRHATK